MVTVYHYRLEDRETGRTVGTFSCRIGHLIYETRVTGQETIDQPDVPLVAHLAGTTDVPQPKQL